jgi:RNA polymerase sigma-70 factor (ECF subfamily)
MQAPAGRMRGSNSKASAGPQQRAGSGRGNGPVAGMGMVSTSIGRVDDSDLIRQAQQGDHAAFEVLVRQYDQAVLRLALHLTGSEADAQDIYQEAFLKAYRHIGNFRFECSFYTWIYRIVTNLCLDHLRRRKTRREDAPVVTDGEGGEFSLLDAVPDDRSGASPERELMRKELGRRIGDALEKLTPRERMVFELKHYQGLKLRTIGEMLNTTEETAKNTLFRATQKLRGQLVPMR